MGNGPSAVGAKGTPTLYIHGLSAPARAAWMTTKAAEIPVHLKYIDPFKGEHKTPDFAKVCPNETNGELSPVKKFIKQTIKLAKENSMSRVSVSMIAQCYERHTKQHN
jgi:hypothetical protein